MSDFLDGSTHFKDFYGKLNVISEIISKKKTTITNTRTTFDTIFGNANKSKPNSHDETDTLKAILTKPHDSTVLIETFDYPKPKEIEGTDYITKKFEAGNFQNQNERIEVKIKFDVEVSPTQSWFDDNLVSIFKINEEDEDIKPNIRELNSYTGSGYGSEYTANIKQLFTFKTVRDKTNPQYVWESKYNMLALFNQPFLLLTFDMYYYNIKNEPLFKNNFDVKEDTAAAAAAAAAATKLLSVESLLNIETFYGKLPTFLMLLIYYAGYRFNIKVEDITSKFRNKFNQSTNGKSIVSQRTCFDIKLYAPIPDKIETKYNNLLKSLIKPTSVDLTYETLEVYHVGSEVKSLWDYVNGKLTILINNMLNSKDKDDKNRYKTLFKKPYTSNSLFLFECIDALKKYKEYILIPANITTIAFPMSTLKTLEILILKLSYILSVLEPTFIPIETMSFDVIMNGKTLKYVINSELQATNISIDDHISNDKLMSAILSTRAAAIETNDTSKTKAKNLLSDSTALELEKSVIKKQADLYHRNYLEKNIAYQRIYSEFLKSDANLTKLTKEYKSAGWEDDKLNNNVTYMNHVVQHAELDLDVEIAVAEKLDYQAKDANGVELLKALDEGTDTTAAYAAISAVSSIDKTRIEPARKRLTEKKKLLEDATKLSSEEEAALNASAERVKALRDKRATSSGRKATAVASLDPNKPVDVTIASQHINNKRRCGFTFGAYNSVIRHDYKLGKIINTDKASIPKKMGLSGIKNMFTPEQWWPFGEIDNNYILVKIEKYKSSTPTDLEPFWDADETVDLTTHKANFDKDADHQGAMQFINSGNYSYEEKERYKNMIYKHQYLFNRLDSLLKDQKYKFTFLKPEPIVSSTVDTGLTGGKNTTKKVNRKQRQRQIQGQIQSKKKKKVFESESKEVSNT